jgi:hypothetical protein
MAFMVVWADGTQNFFDDETQFEIDAGVLELGPVGGEWVHYISPRQWKLVDTQGATLDMPVLPWD